MRTDWKYDIAIKVTRLALQWTIDVEYSEYAIENFKFNTSTKAPKWEMVIDSINGTGDFAASKLDLVTNRLLKSPWTWIKSIHVPVTLVLFWMDLEKANTLSKTSTNQCTVRIWWFNSSMPVKFKKKNAYFL
jgi:hypothetical protein